MQISYNYIIQNDTDQTAFFTIGESGVSYEWHSDIPLGAVVQTYLNENKEIYFTGILRKQYPPAPQLTDPQEWNQWISDGAIVPAILDESGNIIAESYMATKIPWANTHPVPRFKDDGEARSLSTQVESMLQSITYDKIDEHIDNTFSQLSTPQKNSLKLVYKAVYYLLKRD